MDLHVDRMTLRLDGVSPEDARRFARLVAEYLAALAGPETSLSTDRLAVTIAMQPGETLPSAAQRVAEKILFTLARTS